MSKPLIQMALDSLAFEVVKAEQADRRQTMFEIRATREDYCHLELTKTIKPAFRNIGYKARKNKY